MASKIFRSTVFVAVVILLCATLIIMGVLYGYFNDVQIKQLRDELSLAAIGTGENGLDFLEKVDSDRFRITWIAADGTVIYDTHASAQYMENHADREEVREALRYGSGSSDRHSDTMLKRTVYEATRLADGTVLRISLDQQTMTILLAGMLHPMCVVLVIAIILSAVLAGRMSKNIMEPLARLDLEHPLENDTYEELSPILNRLHQQHDQILSQYWNAERTRREFSANVSHELKTPLQSIIGRAELLENGMVKPEDTDRFISHIHKEATRLMLLIEDVIRLSRLDEGVALPREDMDLLAAAEEVAASLAIPAAQKGVTIRVTGQRCNIHGVKSMIYEIVQNLCNNAVKYNVENGTVDVRVEEVEGHVRLTVADTGIGIPAEHQDRIFERFYRVDKSHSRQSGGTGLGLSIVKHSVQHHNARLDLESAPGKGTTITVTF